MSYSQGDLARFFVPLALQAASQSFTYPLVAMVASRGEAGPLGLAGLAQSNLVMFFLAMVGAGIPTAGMVYGREAQGWACFARMNLLMGLGVAGIQALLCVPPLSHLLFGRLIGLPPSIEVPASQTLLGTVILQFLFFLRNPYQVALLVARASGKASVATVGRIGLTAIMTLGFTLAGWVGVGPAVVCLTVPVGLEVVASMALARPYLRSLPHGSGDPPSLGQLLRFVLPLSAGGVVLALSGPILGAFMARAPEPERTLPVYYRHGSGKSHGIQRIQDPERCAGLPSKGGKGRGGAEVRSKGRVRLGGDTPAVPGTPRGRSLLCVPAEVAPGGSAIAHGHGHGPHRTSSLCGSALSKRGDGSLAQEASHCADRADDARVRAPGRISPGLARGFARSSHRSPGPGIREPGRRLGH